MNARRKIMNSATAITLSIAVVLSALITLFPVQAAGETSYPDFSGFVTSDTLTVKDSHGNTVQSVYLDKDSGNSTLPTVQIADGTTVKLSLDFALEDYDSNLNVGDKVAGETYAVELPAALKAIVTTPKDFVNDKGDVLGTWSVDSAGRLLIKFKDNADDFDSRKGNFIINTTFSADKLGSDSGGVIPFHIGGSTVQLPVQVIAPQVNPSVSKQGKLNGDGTITWSVAVNSGNDGFNNGLSDITVTDTISDNQDFQAPPAPTWGETEVGNSGDAPTYEVSGKTAAFHLGNMAHNQTKTLTYTTKVLDPSEKPVFPNSAVQYINTAKLEANEITSGNPSDTKIVENTGTVNSWITKTAGTATTDAVTGRATSIPWSIKVNPNGNGIVPAGAAVADALPKYLTLNGDISLGGTTIGTTDNGTDPYYTTSTNGDIQTITVHFNQAIATEQTLTFNTDVNPNYYKENNLKFSNTATISQGGDTKNYTANGVGPGSSVVSKTGKSYDAATHLVTWTVTVNTNKIAMVNPIVTDTIDWRNAAPTGDHQKFNSISAGGVTLTEAASEADMTATAGTYYVSGKTVKVHLKDFAPGDAPVVLTMKTEVTDPAYYGGNKNSTVYNSASLSTDNEVGGSSDASYTVVSQVISKAGSYDYSTKTLTWDITANQNQMTMTNAIVTDTLPAGLNLTDVRIKGGAVIPEGSGSPYYYTISGQKLTVYLGNLDKQKITIEVTESMLDETLAQKNQGFDVSNTASIHYDELNTTGDPSITTKQRIDQSVVEKKGTLDGTKNLLNWTVMINKNQIPSTNLGIQSGTSVTLSDTLQDGLELDPDSIHLYGLSWDTNQNGKWAKGNEIPITLSESVKYDPSTKLFTFTFPAGTDFSKAYQLEFSTDITKGGDYSNTISMKGTAGNQSGQTTGYFISDQDVQAAFSGLQRGRATVTKVDQETKQPIPGTEFTLYQGTFPIQTLLTNAQGQIVFSNILKQGKEYTIKETKPASGYQSNSTPWTFTVDASNLNLSRTFENLSVNTSSSSQPGSPSSQPGGGSSSSEVSSSESSSSSNVSSSESSSSSSSVSSKPHGGGGGGDHSSSQTSSSSTPSGTSAPSAGSTVSSSSSESAVSSAISSVSSTASVGGWNASLGSIYIKKADKDGKALSGAEFTLFSADGKILQKKTTGSNGLAIFSGLESGEYSVQETKAPAHYELYNTPLNVTLSAGKKVGFTLRDRLEGDTSSGVLGWVSDNTLPKTGEIPITPIVAAGGLLLIITGVVLRRAESRKKQGAHFPDK